VSTQHQLPPPAHMMQLITGCWVSCCIYVAAKLGLADHIAAGATTTAELAEKTGTDPSSLYRTLRALCSVGVFLETDSGTFELTPLGKTLQSGVPGSMKAMALAQLGDHYSAWGELLHSVRTGEIAFDHLHGMSVWKYYESHPEDGVNFTKAMSGLTQAVAANVIPAYDFSGQKTVADIGGGNGALLCAVLKSNPTLTGVVFDGEYVQQQAIAYFKDAGMNGQIKFQQGNFFDETPPRADVYVMKMILHDWNDEDSKKILENIRASMHEESKILVIESVLPEGNTPHPGKFMDINMLAMTGGRERTEREWKELVQRSGLRVSRIIPTQSPMFSIIEVQK
jgi:hypothetical protein